MKPLQPKSNTSCLYQRIFKNFLGALLFLLGSLLSSAQTEILIERLTPDGVELKLLNQAAVTRASLSKTIVLERSLDLKEWSVIGEFDSTLVLEEFVDTNPVEEGAFYRVVAVPKPEKQLNEVIVQFHWNAPPDQLEKLCAAGNLLCPLGIIETPAMKKRSEPPFVCFSCAGNSVETAATLEASPLVLSAVPNLELTIFEEPNDPYFSNGDLFSLSSNGAGSRAVEVWSKGYHGSKDVVIAILDTGIDPNHPDLANNIWTNPNEIPNNGIDDDGNGYIDDLHGWDFTTEGGGDPFPFDANSHGTHVAGISGAEGNNGTGIAGVNWKVSILPLRVIANGRGSLEGIYAAMDYLTDLKNSGVNIVVANYSLGTGPLSSPEQLTLLHPWHSRFVDSSYAGILSICAAGNDELNNNDLNPILPASFNSTSTDFPTQAPYDSIISVASISHLTAELAAYSNLGFNSVDIAATGGSQHGAVLSTIPGGEYALKNGTSMAAPLVSGAVALYAQRFPASSPLARRNAILGSVTTVPGLTSQVSSGGFLNIEQALEYNSSDTNIAPIAKDDEMLVSGSSSIYNVVQNDLDPNGDSLEIVKYSQGAHGIVDRISDEEVRYTPTNSQFKKDSFTYTVGDGSKFSSATVTVLNNTNNHAPTPFDDHITVATNVATPLTPLLWNDRDPNGDRLTIECAGLCDGVGTSPQNGIAYLSSNGFVYQSLPGFVGSDEFTYRVTDGKLSSWATVSVTIVAPGETIGRPDMRKPKNNKDNVMRRTLFKWTDVAGSYDYELEIAKGRKGKVILGFSGIDENKIRLTKDEKLEAGKKHFARARALGENGLPGDWSQYHKFFTREKTRPEVAPLLTAPRNALTTNGTISPVFSWEDVDEADFFIFQLAKNNTSSLSILPEFSIETEDLQLILNEGLEAEQVYFWRVIAANDEGLGEPSEWRSFSTRSILNLNAPLLLSPLNPAANIQTTPSFSWILDSGAMTYTLEIWNINSQLRVRNFEGISGNQFFISEEDALDFGEAYKWRLKAIDAQGNSSPWSSYRVFTVKEAPVEAPILSSPANGQTNFSRTGTFEWHRSKDADVYRLQASESPDFSTLRVDVILGNVTSYQIPDLDGIRLNRYRDYYWRVHAQTADGRNSPFSEVWNFTSSDSAPNATPVLETPSDGVSGQSLTLSLGWSSISEIQAPFYHLQIFRTNSAGNVIEALVHDKYGIPNTAGGPERYLVPAGILEGNTRYRWTVRGISPTGIAGAFAGTWDFRTKETPPAAPSFTSPANGATGLARSGAIFRWTATPGSVIYRLQISETADFSSLIQIDHIVSGTSYTVSEDAEKFIRLTKYYARVHAQNASGQNSSWSPTISFTSEDTPPPTPSLLAPVDGYPVSGVRPRLEWSSINEVKAPNYEVRIFKVSSSGSVDLVLQETRSNDEGSPDGRRVPANILKLGQRYRWQVRAISQTGLKGEWTTTWDFRTE